MIIINKQNKNTKISSKRKEFQENLATFMLLISKEFFLYSYFFFIPDILSLYIYRTLPLSHRTSPTAIIII